MTPEKTKLLFEKHSFLFRGKDLPLTENLMPFGFECGDGWFTLIDELCTTIERIIKEHEEWKDLIVVQVKEKYGTLRFYTFPTPDEIHWVVELAEGLSSRICELCGSPGKTSGRGWVNTLCERCRNGKNN